MRWNSWFTAAAALVVAAIAFLVVGSAVLALVALAGAVTMLVLAQRASRHDPYPGRGEARGTSPYTSDQGRA